MCSEVSSLWVTISPKHAMDGWMDLLVGTVDQMNQELNKAAILSRDKVNRN